MATMQSMSPGSETPASLTNLWTRLERFLGQDVGLGRRREARHMTLKEKFVPRRILHRERDELGHELLQGGARLARKLDRVEPLQKLPVAVSEHCVVERQLGVEIGVERRLAHPHVPGQCVQRDAYDAVFPGKSPCRFYDFGHLAVSALRDSIYHR